MDSQRTAEAILADIAAIPTMERGKLCEIRRTSGRVYHNLQVWRNGRNVSVYVSARELVAVREAVANHARFCELVEEYAALKERETRRARKRSGDPEKKKGSAKRSWKRRSGN